MYTYLEGKPQSVGSEAETLAMVRSVLTEVEETEARSPLALFRKAQADMAEKHMAPKRKKVAMFVPLNAADEAEDAAQTSHLRTALKRVSVKSTLKKKSLRLKRKHLVFALLGILFLVRPLWMLTAIAVLLCVAALYVYLAGAEKVWRGVMLALHNLAETDPIRATMLRARLDRFATQWDAFLDRFPDGMVDALYMPDFQVLSQDEAARERVLTQRIEQLKTQQ